MASGEWRVASQERLQAETFLRGIEHHDEIASTNDRALELCADASLPTPFLIITDRQTAGRGRGANRWWSSDGALLFSVIIDATAFSLPEFLWPQVSLTTGAAICDRKQQSSVAGPPTVRAAASACGLPIGNDEKRCRQ